MNSVIVGTAYCVIMYKIDTNTSRQSVKKKNENDKCKIVARVMCGIVAITL